MDLTTLNNENVRTAPYIRTVEWEMLNKKKFFPLSIASSFTVRTVLYPLTLIKTRLQIQKGNEVYKGTFDAFRKIIKYEGVKGLYKGFWVNVFSIVSGTFYILTYENVRYVLLRNNVTDSRLRALIAGGCASLVGQTIIVPVDVISQHLMMMGLVSIKKKKINSRSQRNRGERGTFKMSAELGFQITKKKV